MSTLKEEFQRQARAAKRKGYDPEKVAPKKEPFRSIFLEAFKKAKVRPQRGNA